MVLASFKYILTIPYAKIIGLNYSQALIAVVVGGIGGFLFFFYLSNWAIRKYKFIKPYLFMLVPKSLESRYTAYYRKKASMPKKIFSRKSRLIVRIRKSYGLWGIIIATPVFLTIPLGAFLASRYYSGKRNVVVYMLASIVGWAVFLTTAVHIIPQIIR